jgi:hypothetical protein
MDLIDQFFLIPQRLYRANAPIRKVGGAIMSLKKLASAIAIAAVCSAVANNSFAAAMQRQVTVQNNSPTGGVAITPVWVGFHEGSFDSYDGGSPSAASLESLAELGMTAPISDVFAGTLIGDPLDGRVQGAIANGGPIFAGGSAAAQFTVDNAGANTYFSYAATVLPSNDFFVANGNPFAHRLSSLFNGSASTISFNIGTVGTVNDAGTEINDFLFSAGNGIAGIPGGDATGGAVEGGVITNVVGDPFAGFLNNPGTGGALNVNDLANYANGIATITISVVPAPAPVPVPAALPPAISALGGLFAFVRRRKRS